MQSMQRKFGKMLKRQENDTEVSNVLAEFKAAGEMLKQMSEMLKIWRDGWEDILKLQYDAAEAFSILYKPIEEAISQESQHQPVQTPARFLNKSLSLQKAYAELRTDLAKEIEMVDGKLIRPVYEARNLVKPMKTLVKHREDMKLDYERYYSRAEHARKKESRNMKEETVLARAESDLVQSQIDYEHADEQIRETFPPVIAALKSLMPYLLAQQVMLQHTLVAQVYTVLDEYCRQHRMESPAPPDAQIISVFEREYTPLRKEVESGLRVISNGKTVNLPMALPAEKGSTLTGLGLRNHTKAGMTKGMGMIRKKSDQSALTQHSGASPSAVASSDYFEEEEEEEPAPVKPPRPGTLPSTPSNRPRIGSGMSSPRPNPPYPDSTRSPGYPASPWADQTSQSRTPPSRYGTPPESANGNGSLQPDYFAGTVRQPSSSSVASSIAAKKKPPPPVPQKRIPSMQSQWVTALYDFDGQNHGDLGFRQGDRIRVVKKTESQDDWWEGELKGVHGSFPANYVKAVVGGVPL